MSDAECISVPLDSDDHELRISCRLGPPEDGGTNLLGITVHIPRSLARRMAVVGSCMHVLPQVERLKLYSMLRADADPLDRTAMTVSVLARAVGAELAFACAEAVIQAIQQQESAT